tara:strand:- start:786 stop:2114 length:1329 start_codon:yes stop_codon:yes gene_type:complete
MAGTRLTETMGTPTLGTKFTYSFWVKRSGLGAAETIASMWVDASNHIVLRFDAQDNLSFYANVSGSYPLELETNAVFRDTAAWYHIVAKVDTTQGTASDRCKLYVNGVEQTSLAASTYPSQDATFSPNASGTTHYIGGRGDGSYWNGLMSYAMFTDGSAYDASSFGSTDATTGEWKITTGPSLTYGNNGFFILKDGNSVTDQSGNSNNFTVSDGTLTQTEDNPSNNFATLNNLIKNNASFDYGNLKLTTTVGTKDNAASTIGVSQGKWYAEAKLIAQSAARFVLGVSPDPQDLEINNNFVGYQTDSVAYASDGEVYKNTSSQYTGSTYTTNDIVGIALDLDNNNVYFHKNGTYQNSGDPTSGATGTGAVSLTSPSSLTTGFYFIAMGDTSNVHNITGEINFGNGYFGTTAISSEGTNASGYGKFEYDVPTGYTALCTKGLNE